MSSLTLSIPPCPVTTGWQREKEEKEGSLQKKNRICLNGKKKKIKLKDS